MYTPPTGTIVILSETFFTHYLVLTLTHYYLGRHEYYHGPYTWPLFHKTVTTLKVCSGSAVVSGDRWGRWRMATSLSIRQHWFFSPVHQTYSCIHDFLVDEKWLSQVKACTYNSIVISDHSPLVLELSSPHQNSIYSWRLNPLLLSDAGFLQYISKQMDLVLNTITEDMWQSVLHRVRSSSICARHGLLQLKVLHGFICQRKHEQRLIQG